MPTLPTPEVDLILDVSTPNVEGLLGALRDAERAEREAEQALRDVLRLISETLDAAY